MNHIPRITIKLIDPANQRFSECGDWFYDAEDDTLTIFISRMEDWRSELAVAIHELFESVSCIAAGIDQTDVDAFDKTFYQLNETGEAGDSRDSPYFEQHKSATFVEQEACSQLKLPWVKHSSNCDDV
jgi:hypothetical protein